MVDIAILHLWRGSERFFSDTFQFADQTRVIRSAQEYFARSVGTMERFRVRVSGNDSTTPFTITFQINGVVKQTVGPIAPGQLGTFLPALQLPLGFAKDDLLVMQLTGLTPILFCTLEFNCDLKFTD